MGAHSLNKTGLFEQLFVDEILQNLFSPLETIFRLQLGLGKVYHFILTKDVLFEGWRSCFFFHKFLQHFFVYNWLLGSRWVRVFEKSERGSSLRDWRLITMGRHNFGKINVSYLFHQGFKDSLVIMLVAKVFWVNRSIVKWEVLLRVLWRLYWRLWDPTWRQHQGVILTVCLGAWQPFYLR